MATLYAAPMEGITGFVWRKAHREIFGGADKYCAPFFSPDQNMRLQAKDLRELSNGETDLIPQVLVNRADYFIWAARELSEMGYREIDLNLGCPSGTVVAKHKGSGLLRETESLDELLDTIFSTLPDISISAKTRIGLKTADEWPALLRIFEKYPFSSLIIHPRLQVQGYTGLADRSLFLQTLKGSSLPLVYNGDVLTPDDPAFSYGCGVMAGRGLVRDPALFREQRGGSAASRSELDAFHSLLVSGYSGYMQGELPLIHRMREFWAYFSYSFRDTEDAMKRMNKARHYSEYKEAAEFILRNCPLRNAT